MALRHLVAGCAALAAVACDSARDRAPTDVPVRVGAIAVDRFDSPVVILEESGGPRRLPIWIGLAEATSISAELAHRTPLRPNSHDFAKRLLDSLDARVVRVVVTELRSGTYYATLVLQARGKSTEIDARPSDAIALALRAGAPILVREELFDAADRQLGGDEAGESVAYPPLEGGSRAATTGAKI